MTDVALHPPASALHRSASQQPAGVAVAGLYKGFGAQPVLRGVTLEVPKGSVTAIVGPSGSGKTTLLRVLAGFERADQGTVSIGGITVDGPGRHVPPGARRVGYVPQEGSLFPHLNVAANIGFGLPRSRRHRQVAQLMEMTGLSRLAKRYPHQLSGGEQQRVALARALAPDPSLVLLDEPFSSLDAFLRTSVRHDVARILGQAGTTTVIVTHDQDEALSIADQVAVFRNGQVAQAGSPQAVYNQPADPALAQFIGDANLIAGTVRAQGAETIFGLLPLAPNPSGAPAEGAAVTVLLRPEQLEVAPAASGAGQGPGRVAGRVVRRDYHGHDTVVAVDTGLASGPLNVRCSGPSSFAPGTQVTLAAHGPVTAWAEAAAK